MPCGGIYPWKKGPGQPHNGRCYHCGSSKPEPTHMVEEWDAFIHPECVVPFLATQEGQIVLDHKHDIHIMFDYRDGYETVEDSDDPVGWLSTDGHGPRKRRETATVVSRKRPAPSVILDDSEG